MQICIFLTQVIQKKKVYKHFNMNLTLQFSTTQIKLQKKLNIVPILRYNTVFCHSIENIHKWGMMTTTGFKKLLLCIIGKINTRNLFLLLFMKLI
jgi:hypothetical protein